MTRKITLSIILILLLWGCYEIGFGNNQLIRKNVSSVTELERSSKQLNLSSTQLEKNCTTDYETKKTALEKAIKDYQESKKEYEEIIPQYSIGNADDIDINEIKDIYDVDFLWTIVGNYATEEGINLKFDINKNINSASSINNTSSNYVVCDLKFTITGNYINLTDFIYDLEDDDRLNFEINDFSMQKDGENLQVTLTVKEIKVNSDNLIETMTAMNSSESDSDKEQDTNDTTNTTNTTDTATNTTNTTNQTINSNTTKSVN